MIDCAQQTVLTNNELQTLFSQLFQGHALLQPPVASQSTYLCCVWNVRSS